MHITEMRLLRMLMQCDADGPPPRAEHITALWLVKSYKTVLDV